MDSPHPAPRLGALILVYNERENVEPLLEELLRTMRGMESSFEILFVNDGSTDGSRELLDWMAKEHREVRVVHLERNAGQSAALLAGFEAARAEILITLDGDMQNDPADIPRLLEWIPQADMVVGIRRDRRDSWLRRVSSRIANAVRSRVLGDGIEDTGCSLKVFHRALTPGFPRFRGLHRFLPALVLMQGGRVAQVPVRHRPRHAGAAKYNVRNRLFRGLADLLGVCWLKLRWASYRIAYEAPGSSPAGRERARIEEDLR